MSQAKEKPRQCCSHLALPMQLFSSEGIEIYRLPRRTRAQVTKDEDEQQELQKMMMKKKIE